jgi:hypothetical protein
MEEVGMFSRSALRAPEPMNDDERFDRLERKMETIERRLTERLAEEIGKLRLEMRDEFGKVRLETAGLRAEMIDRNFNLLKWLLGFFAAQTAALAALMALFR